MPYIVTTKRPDKVDYDMERAERGEVSRRAVGTLEEAREHLMRIAPNGEPDAWRPFFQVAHALSESGGTVGPLPDGTVIEVEQVDIREIAYRADFRWQTRRASDVTPEILNAFNARHGR